MLRIISQIMLAVLVGLIGLLIFSHATAPSSMAFSPTTATDYNEIGLKLHQSHNAHKALYAFKKAIRLDPGIPEFRFNLAFVYGNWPAVISQATGIALPELFEAMLEESKAARLLSPSDFEFAEGYASNFYLAEKFGVEPDWDEAIAAWKHCLRIRERQFAESPERRSKQLRIPILLHMARIERDRGALDKAREYSDRSRGFYHPRDPQPPLFEGLK